MKVEEIFNRALDMTATDQRDAFVASACGTDAALLAKVQRLLKAHDEASQFLQDPLFESAATVDEVPREGPGTVIGPYKLLQEIGHGGMGMVFMAEQHEPVRRKVALKIIKPGMDSRQVLARFEAERQALSLMDHPNIAKVLDAGTTSTGRPYFVMELVKGQPITQYCDENKLTPRERLELLLPVCHAIQHAHQKGIIHRDIKPSNILVAEYDQKPVPKVIDFGVAKAISQPLTDKTMFTGFGNIVGTLEYMSPEQAKVNQLDIDTRSDIYSLGVLMYELLTGTTPFDKKRLRDAAWDEILRIIREEDPPKPSTRLFDSKDSLSSISAQRHTEPDKLTKLVRGELDWIVMKALEKDRSRRYETANGLAMDLQRYLNDEAVSACPPSAGYRFKKYARRNQSFLIAGGLVFTAMVIGTVVSLWQTFRAVEAGNLARQHLEDEKQARYQAQIAERNVKEQLFAAYQAQSRAAKLSGRPGQRLHSLDAITKAVGLIEPLGLGTEARSALRNEAIACLQLIDVRQIRRWKARQNLSQGSAFFSADFELLAFSDASNIHVRQTVNPDVDIRHISIERGVYESFMAFDPSKKYLLRWRWHPKTRMTFITEISSGKDILNVPDVMQFAAADFHPIQTRFATGNRQGTVQVFDLLSGEMIHTFTVGKPVSCLKYDPLGKWLAVVTDHLEIRHAETGDLIRSYPHKGEPIAWRSDSKALAIGATPDFYVLEVENPLGSRITCRGHTSTVINLQFHIRGQLLASTSWDGTTRLWDAISGRQLLQLEGQLIALSSDGKWLACREGLDIVLYEIVEQSVQRWLTQGKAHSVALASDNRFLAIGQEDGLGLMDLDNPESLRKLPIGVTEGIVFRSASKEMITSGSGGMLQWSIQRIYHEKEHRLLLSAPRKFIPPVANSTAIHCSQDGKVILAELFYSQEALVLRHNKSPLRLARPGLVKTALSPDGQWVAAGSGAEKDVRIWNAVTGEHLRDLPTSGGSKIRFSPNGRTLITNCGTELRLWDVETWQMIHEMKFNTDSAAGVAFAPDGLSAAVAVWGRGAVLLNLQTKKQLAAIDLPINSNLFVDMCFSTDGSRLIVAADYSGSFVWDLFALRKELSKLNLDWESPRISHNEEANQPALKIEWTLPADHFWSELGAEQYRARDYTGAVEALSKVVRCPKDDNTDSLFYIAMSRWKLGHKEEALRVFHQAVGLLSNHPFKEKERYPLLHEAADVLGVKLHAQPKK